MMKFWFAYSQAGIVTFKAFCIVSLLVFAFTGQWQLGEFLEGVLFGVLVTVFLFHWVNYGADHD